jgi:rod shape-determining protein MreD
LNPGIFTALWLLPVLSLLQASLMSHLAFRGAVAGIVLITVVDWGILRGMDEGLIWALIGGLCLDVFTGWPVGTSVVALVVVASIVSLGEVTFIRTHALLPPATVFGGTVLFYLVALFILESVHQPVDWLTVLRAKVIPIAAYNALLNIPGFWALQRLERRIYPMPRANW